MTTVNINDIKAAIIDDITGNPGKSNNLTPKAPDPIIDNELAMVKFNLSQSSDPIDRAVYNNFESVIHDCYQAVWDDLPGVAADQQSAAKKAKLDQILLGAGSSPSSLILTPDDTSWLKIITLKYFTFGEEYYTGRLADFKIDLASRGVTITGFDELAARTLTAAQSASPTDAARSAAVDGVAGPYSLEKAKADLDKAIIEYIHSFESGKGVGTVAAQDARRRYQMDATFQAISSRLADADKPDFKFYYDVAIAEGIIRLHQERAETTYEVYQFAAAGWNVIVPIDPFTSFVDPVNPLIFRSSPYSFEELPRPRAERQDWINIGAQTLSSVPHVDGFQLPTFGDDLNKFVVLLDQVPRAQMHRSLEQRAIPYAGADRPPLEMGGAVVGNFIHRIATGQMALDRLTNIQINQQVAEGEAGLGGEAQKDTQILCSDTGNTFNTNTGGCEDSEGNVLQAPDLCVEAGGTFDTSNGTCSVIDNSNDQVDSIIGGFQNAIDKVAYLDLVAGSSINSEVSGMNWMRLGYETGGDSRAIAFGIAAGVYNAAGQPLVDLGIRGSMPEGAQWRIKLPGVVEKENPSSVDTEEMNKDYFLEMLAAGAYGGAGAVFSYKNGGSFDRPFASYWARNAQDLFGERTRISLDAYYAQAGDDNQFLLGPRYLFLASEVGSGAVDIRQTVALLQRDNSPGDWRRNALAFTAKGVAYGLMAYQSGEENDWLNLECRLGGVGAGLVTYVGIPALIHAIDKNPKNAEKREAKERIQFADVVEPLPESGGLVAFHPIGEDHTFSLNVAPTVLASTSPPSFDTMDGSIPTALRPAAAMTLTYQHKNDLAVNATLTAAGNNEVQGTVNVDLSKLLFGKSKK